MLAEQITISYLGPTQKDRAMCNDPTSVDTARDLALICRIRAREEAAIQELYAVYGQRLYSYALRLTGDACQAEDVVQDALVVVWKSAGAYRGEGRLVAWLMRIVHHTAIKSLRHRPTPLSEEMEERLSAAEPLPEEHTLSSEQTEWVRRGLERLSPEHRAVLEMVFYQGFSLQETAEVCECPIGTVKSRLSHARKQLRGVLSLTKEIR